MKRPITAGGEAMPAAATQEQIAEALLALENQVHELMLMSDIAANAWDNIGPPQKIEGDAIYYRCTKRERDCFDFLLNDVAVRAQRLRDSFYAGSRGEIRT